MKKIRIPLIVILLILAVLYSAGMVYETRAETADRERFSPAGRLVDVNGRAMHIYCIGERAPGQPVIILEAGLGDHLYSWSSLQTKVSGFARVCAYDRAGMGWSEPSRAPRTAGQIADELNTLLANAQESGPYVMVGHSYGGLITRIFAARYPESVVGVLLVDSTNADDFVTYPTWALKIFPIQEIGVPAFLQNAGLLRLAGIKPTDISEYMGLLPAETIPAAFALALRADSVWATYHEMMLMPESAREAVQAGNLGDLPVIALITPAEEDGSFPELYRERFLALSSNSQVDVIDCGHYVHWEQPELVLEAIRGLATVR
ncbi:MAG TPA: alpha/beta hydrolase [Anaerolineales bacterium]|nr:alpha/beta hydrolase [Anaerolineales bacterium]